MAEAQRSIFNETARKRLTTPDDLDKYLQVTNPSVWTLLIACTALLAGILTWGTFGSISTSVSGTSVVMDDGRILCFLNTEDAKKVHVGDVASVGGQPVKVSSITTVPSSSTEARKILGSDYLTSVLFTGDWAYMVEFQKDTYGDRELTLSTNVPLETTITTERVAPFSLLFKGKG